MAALAWSGAEAIIANGSGPLALHRALDDPGYGTRILPESVGVVA